MAWWPFGKKKKEEEEIVEEQSFRVSDDDADFSLFRHNDEPSAPAAEAVNEPVEPAYQATVAETQLYQESPVQTAAEETVAAAEPGYTEVPAAVMTQEPEGSAEAKPEDTAGEAIEDNSEGVSEEVSEEAEPEEEDKPKKKGFFGLFGSKDKSADTQDESGEEAVTEAGAEPAEEEEKEKPKKKGFFARLKEGLAKTRDNFVYSLDIIFDGAAAIDDDFYEELEEILIMGDIGVRTTEEILDTLKEQVEDQHIVRPTECKELLIKDIRDQMHVGNAAYDFEKQQSVVFVIGVNGVGKTTSIGKIASHLKAQGKRVMMAAADTFRAAAGDQLKVWADRAGVELIGGREGADPSSVLYDATAAAKARGVDVLLVDTAGRLNNKKNLMEELKKMNRVIDKEFPQAHRENLIVLDATTGQNALQQARDFNDVADLSGIILTKMDGTAKGGIAVAIQSELKVPVKYIGVGEHIEDLQKFDADAFVEALFDVELEKDEDEKDEDLEDGEDA